MPYETFDQFKFDAKAALSNYCSQKRLGVLKPTHFDAANQEIKKIDSCGSKEELLESLYEFYKKHAEMFSEKLVNSIARILGVELDIPKKMIEHFLKSRSATVDTYRYTAFSYNEVMLDDPIIFAYKNRGFLRVSMPRKWYSYYSGFDPVRYMSCGEYIVETELDDIKIRANVDPDQKLSSSLQSSPNVPK